MAKPDTLAARIAQCGLEIRRIRQLLEVVLVGSVPNIHFSFHAFGAFRTVLPIPFVPLREMVTTQGVSSVVSAATVAGKGKGGVLVLIIAYPVATALGSGERLRRTSAQTATGLVFLGWLLRATGTHGFLRHRQLLS